MTLPRATLFPEALLPLYIFEPRYRQMLTDMLQTERMFSVAMQKPDKIRESPCTVAGLGLIRVSVGHADGTSHLILQGLARVELAETVQTKPYRIHSIRPIETPANDSVTVDALVEKVHELVAERFTVGPPPAPFAKAIGRNVKGGKNSKKATSFSLEEILRYLRNLPSVEQVADLVTCALLNDPMERQTILETIPIEERLRRLIRFLLAEIEQYRKDNPHE